MNRYMIKFSKEGDIRYISHLDLLRLFKRSFKRAGIKLVHSQGFNPHPKMSFAQPLSLGYLSSGEYLEFDTVDTHSTESIIENLSTLMPDGICILSCMELPVPGKSLAALTNAASYEILLPEGLVFSKDIEDLICDYLTQNHVFIIKHQKKSNKDIEIDVRPLIHTLEAVINDNLIMLITKLSAGSTENLSPEIVLSSFLSFAGISLDRADVLIRRKDIYFDN